MINLMVHGFVPVGVTGQFWPYQGHEAMRWHMNAIKCYADGYLTSQYQGYSDTYCIYRCLRAWKPLWKSMPGEHMAGRLHGGRHVGECNLHRSDIRWEPDAGTDMQQWENMPGYGRTFWDGKMGEVFKSELRSRKRQDGEALPSLAYDISRIVSSAYHDMDVMG